MLDFLAIGHITIDRLPGGDTSVGGTATFTSITAERLGCHAAVLTRAADNVDLNRALPGVQVCRLPSPVTTTFENIYRLEGRQQVIGPVAAPIHRSELPLGWDQAESVLLGPVAQEVDPAFAGAFPGALMGVVPQGWMRYWPEGGGTVTPQVWECATTVLPQADVVVVSQEDLAAYPSGLDDYLAGARLLVVTQGKLGSVVYQNGHATAIEPRPAQEIDPTGAGDVFTAAFLIRLRETGDPLVAARFANIVASFSVEGPGTSAVPTRAQVEGYVAEHV